MTDLRKKKWIGANSLPEDDTSGWMTRSPLNMETSIGMVSGSEKNQMIVPVFHHILNYIFCFEL